MIVRLFIAYSSEWYGGSPLSSDRQSALVPVALGRTQRNGIRE